MKRSNSTVRPRHSTMPLIWAEGCLSVFCGVKFRTTFLGWRDRVTTSEHPRDHPRDRLRDRAGGASLASTPEKAEVISTMQKRWGAWGGVPLGAAHTSPDALVRYKSVGVDSGSNLVDSGSNLVDSGSNLVDSGPTLLPLGGAHTSPDALVRYTPEPHGCPLVGAAREGAQGPTSSSSSSLLSYRS